MRTIFHLALLLVSPRKTHGLAVLHPEVVETSPKLHAGPARQDFLHFLRSLSAELTCSSSIVFDEGSDRGDPWEIDPPRDRRVGTERPLVAGTDFEGRFAHGSSHNVLYRRLLRPNLAKPRCFRMSTVPPRPLHPSVHRGTKRGVFFLFVPLIEGVRPTGLPFNWTRISFRSDIRKGMSRGRTEETSWTWSDLVRNVACGRTSARTIHRNAPRTHLGGVVPLLPHQRRDQGANARKRGTGRGVDAREEA